MHAMLKLLSMSVEDINSYYKLIYQTNWQTIQMPLYEADVRINAHKFVGAYVGFLSLLVARHAKWLTMKTNEAVRGVTALINGMLKEFPCQ